MVTFIPIPNHTFQISSRDLFDGKVPSKHENKLRLCFKELLKKSGDALKRNRQFIKKDQEAYQNQLEKSYHQCMEYLKPLIQPAGAPANLPLGVRWGKCYQIIMWLIPSTNLPGYQVMVMSTPVHSFDEEQKSLATCYQWIVCKLHHTQILTMIRNLM